MPRDYSSTKTELSQLKSLPWTGWPKIVKTKHSLDFALPLPYKFNWKKEEQINQVFLFWVGEGGGGGGVVRQCHPFVLFESSKTNKWYDNETDWSVCWTMAVQQINYYNKEKPGLRIYPLFHVLNCSIFKIPNCLIKSLTFCTGGILRQPPS